MSHRLTKKHENVIPAQAGIQNAGRGLDSHSPLTTCGDKLRGNDGHTEGFRGLYGKGNRDLCLVTEFSLAGAAAGKLLFYRCKDSLFGHIP